MAAPSASPALSRIVNGPINVTAGSYVFLNDFWRDFDSATPTDNIGRTITHNGQLTGSSDLGVAVNRAGYQWNNGTFVLRNAANSYSGIITVGEESQLREQLLHWFRQDDRHRRRSSSPAGISACATTAPGATARSRTEMTSSSRRRSWIDLRPRHARRHGGVRCGSFQRNEHR